MLEASVEDNSSVSVDWVATSDTPGLDDSEGSKTGVEVTEKTG